MGHVEIGIRYYGKTEAIGKEAVYTSFLVIAVPLVPLACWYGVRTGNFNEHFHGQRLRWHLRSALLGYLRWAAVVPPVITFCEASPNQNHADWNLPLLLLSIFLAGVYAALFFLFVKASPQQTRQRKLLSRLAGSTVNPSWLPREECERIIARLQPVLESLNVPVDSRVWQMRTPEPEIAPFVYTMARYMEPLEPDNDWDEVSGRIWSQMETEARASHAAPLARIT